MTSILHENCHFEFNDFRFCTFYLLPFVCFRCCCREKILSDLSAASFLCKISVFFGWRFYFSIGHEDETNEINKIFLLFCQQFFSLSIFCALHQYILDSIVRHVYNHIFFCIVIASFFQSCLFFSKNNKINKF